MDENQEVNFLEWTQTIRNALPNGDSELVKGLFVRDVIGSIFFDWVADAGTNYISVVGYYNVNSQQHSIFKLYIPHVGTLHLRNDTYNWVVTCNLNVPLPNRFGRLFDPRMELTSPHAFGIDDAAPLYGSFLENQQRFTVQINAGGSSEEGDTELYAFAFLIDMYMRELGVIP